MFRPAIFVVINFLTPYLSRPHHFPLASGLIPMRCNQDTIKLTATQGFINYQWQPQYNLTTITSQSVHVFPLRDTSYTATAEKWPGCFVNDTIKIKVFTSAPIALGSDTSLCTGQSLILNAGAAFNTYTWSTGEVSQQITVNKNGIYIVHAVAANTCTSSDTLEVINVAPLPVFTLGSDTVLCSNTLYSYNFNLTGATYLWNDGGIAGSHSITQPGTYSLAVTQQGCTATDTVVINYKKNPAVNLGNDTALCSGTTYLLNATYNGATYVWQDGSISPGFLVSTPGSYIVALDLNGCLAKDTIQVSYLSPPQFSLGRDTVICMGQQITLTPGVQSPAGFLWQDGSTRPTLIVTDTGYYSLQVTNTCGSFSDEIFIGQGACSLILPTAFTPNGDGLNDVFRVKYAFPVQEFTLSIYNRFGEKMFETPDITKGWDGKYKGVPQPVGAYVWTTRLFTSNHISQASKGVVILIR